MTMSGHPALLSGGSHPYQKDIGPGLIDPCDQGVIFGTVFGIIAMVAGDMQRWEGGLKAAGGRGRVVAISTLNAHVFRCTYPIYPGSAAAKAGLEALVRTLAVQLAPFKVTVNCVAPGIIEKDADTIQFYSDDAWKPLIANVPLGRLGKQDEVAAMVAFLAGPDASYVTNQIIHVNGGIV